LAVPSPGVKECQGEQGKAAAENGRSASKRFRCSLVLARSCYRGATIGPF
jgi:hypothetical protein